MSAELAVLEELDAHRPSHREYEGGWWELACAGCDAFKGQRLSHLDWAPYRAHREELFRDALQAAGFRKPKVIQYMVVTQDGGLYDCNFGLNREAAQAVVDQATADAAALGIDYSYRVAEVIEPEAAK